MADLNTFVTRWLYSRLPLIGASGGSASGVLTYSTTTAGTIADTNETDLWTYSLPANTLDVNGRAVRVTVWGTTGATANSKTVRVKFGSSTVTSISGASNGSNWWASFILFRTGASAEAGMGTILMGGVSALLGSNPVTPAENTANAITIKMTGQNGTAAANDVVFNGALVELLN